MRPRSRAGRLRLAAGLLGILALTASSAGPAARTAAADGAPSPLGDLTFYGRGYGHGVGMSQYGARGRALAGQTAAQILAHYYAGTTLAALSDLSTIRVLLLTGFGATTAKPLTVVAKGAPWTIDGIATTFPVGAKLTLAPTAVGATTWTLTVSASTGVVLAKATVSGDVYARPTTSAGLLQLVSKAVAQNVYRGSFRIHLTKTAMVINTVSIGSYLRGVVPLEMPSSWPVEALKAQAIAARSYAFSHRHPTTGSYDVYDDTRSQVYRGQLAETTNGTSAVVSTAGLVLKSGTVVANAVFHSSDGGATENNENVWVSATGAITSSPVSYLRGSSDRAPDGTAYDAASPYATWKTATYTADVLSAMFALDARTNVGALSAIDLTRRGVSGRLISVTLSGVLGTKTVSGDVFRSVFNAQRPATDPQLRSTLFDTAPIP